MNKSISFVTVSLVLLFTVSALAADKVVVVPLGGAVGNATIEDVVKGKTFSNSTEKGLTGTLKLTPAPTGDAVSADVLEGKTFSNNVEVGIPGTMPTQSLDPNSSTVSAGYYEATTLYTVDTQLKSVNIKKGINLFGVEGEFNCLEGSMLEDLSSDCTGQCYGNPIFQSEEAESSCAEICFNVLMSAAEIAGCI